MRALLAATALLSLSCVLPAAAAPCQGTIVLQDPFTTPNPALNVAASPQSKITIQGGKAEVTFLQAAGRSALYGTNQYGNANVCATFATAATDKAETQTAGIVFWAADSSNYFTFQIQPSGGQFAVAQLAADTTWTLPLAWTASAAIVKTMGSANVLQVQTRGNVVTLFINGQQVGTFTGTAPSGGGIVGFFADTSTTSLDTWDISDFSVGIP